MNCTKCGQPLDPGAEFCGNCGQPVNTVTNEPQQPPTQPQQFGATQPGVGLPPVPPTQGSSSQQDAQVMQQVLTNQPSVNNASFGAPSVAGAGGRNIPAYAIAPITPEAHKVETLAIIGLIVGILGIPSAIFPLAGLGLGITGIIISTIARSKHKSALSMIGIILSALAVLISIAALVFAIELASKSSNHSSNTSTNNGVSTTGNANSANKLSTPCYTTQLESGMDSSGQLSGCNYTTPQGTVTTVDFDVAGSTIPGLNSGNFDQAAQGVFNNMNSQSGFTFGSMTKTTFAGSPAYQESANYSANGESLLYVVTYHPTSNGENLFLIGIGLFGGQKPTDFGSVQSSWQWK